MYLEDLVIIQLTCLDAPPPRGQHYPPSYYMCSSQGNLVFQCLTFLKVGCHSSRLERLHYEVQVGGRLYF
jgi:hypothetical protein